LATGGVERVLLEEIAQTADLLNLRSAGHEYPLRSMRRRQIARNGEACKAN
jgi:hypothetical protein